MAAFFVSCTGQIEKAEVRLIVNCVYCYYTYMIYIQLGDLDDLYCRYAFHFGPDWTIVAVQMSESRILYGVNFVCRV